ncbi:MAG: type IV pilus assembly protein PilM [Candidatus Marinimicrobia bacterium]|nr:type IV pilus assembly protein PilM [Candidatus Neomarinimicrobiota bacterium]MBL7022878.1 type IV pilus assembly protein PilM [Candidatus Neomarinimicrobiota bacterium]MBL7109197.1 type IV pilus assembly protein PilM [Candidatus Neomarinimicrobiota bacterium]
MSALGIDFGYYSVKIVQLEKNASGYTLINAGNRRIIDEMDVFDPEIIDKSHWVAAILDLCKEMKINPKRIKNVVSSISGNFVSIKQITTLEMSNQELISSLEFEAKKHIPLDGSSAVMDYHIIGSDAKELDKINVLLVATTKKLLNQHHEIIQNVGFKTGVFDTDPVSALNVYLALNGLTSDGVDVILNLGNNSSTLIVWGSNQRIFTRELQTAGHHFTKAIMEAHSISYSEAETMKFEKGVDAVNTNSIDSESSTSFGLEIAEKTIFASFGDEIRKTLRYYLKSSANTHFNRFFLTGGSAVLPGLQAMLSEYLNMTVEILNPCEKIDHKLNIENPTQYTVAVGAAIRGLEKKV